MGGVCAKEEPIGNRNQFKGKRDKEDQVGDDMHDVAHNTGKHRINDIHGDIGFSQETKGTDQDDIAAEAHHNHIHRPDLWTVQDTAHELVPVTYRFFLRAYTTHELGYSVWQPVTWPVRLALFVGMLLLAIQGISEILKHVDWVIEYIRNGCKDPQIDEGPSAAEAVIL